MYLSACLVVVALSGGGVAKQPASGIEQFWTDDYKVFDQVYGKTSDKEIFGATLPPSISFGIDASKLNKEASEKKERYIDTHHNTDLDIDQTDPYNYGARYPGLTNQALKNLVNKKPPKTAPKFIPSDFKPIITQDNDPETYNYLKHLELLQKQKEQFSSINLNGFKPFLNYGAGKAEDTDAYKSIQDILEAHEANKGKVNDNDETDDQVKYLTYGGNKGRVPNKKTKPRAPPPGKNGKGNNTKGNLGKGKPSCTTGRCRKRTTTTYRGRTYLTRPYVRKIKHKIVRY